MFLSTGMFSSPVSKRVYSSVCFHFRCSFPHVGQNLWFTFEDKAAVLELIEALHAQGARESALKKELQKREGDMFATSRK